MVKYCYEIEFYDFIENVGLNTTNITYTNKEEVLNIAKDIYKGLCDNDKRHISVLVNKVYNNNEFELIKEFSRGK